MAGYLVTAVFDVPDADSPQDAARQAYQMMTDPSAIAPMVEVKADDGSTELVDLEPIAF